MGRTLGLAALILPLMPVLAARPAGGEPIVESVALVMRHGVRAPLSLPPMAAGVAAQPWRPWSVGKAELTPHGAEAVRRIGAFDRRHLAEAARACPRPSEVAIAADLDQRTMATARAWIDGFAPGCEIPIEHVSRAPDPLFAPIASGATQFDPDEATRAVVARMPSLPELDAQMAGPLGLVDRILCSDAAPRNCGVASTPSTLRPASRRHEPVLEGALAQAATAAQVLTLEFLDGAPLSAVGWGRATAADLERLGQFRTLGYAIIQRTPYVARAFGGPILQRMVNGVVGGSGLAPRLTLLVGHDSNIAAVAGLLDLHWKAAGFATDDPPPGGALGLQRLRDRRGHVYIRAIFRAASLQAIRRLRDPDLGHSLFILPIGSCRPTPNLCPLDQFVRIARKSLAR